MNEEIQFRGTRRGSPMTEQEFLNYFISEIADDETNDTAKEMLDFARSIIASREDAVNRYESIVMSIQRACEGTRCLNAYELRVKCDWAMDIVHNGFDDVDQKQIDENYYEARHDAR